MGKDGRSRSFRFILHFVRPLEMVFVTFKYIIIGDSGTVIEQENVFWVLLTSLANRSGEIIVAFAIHGTTFSTDSWFDDWCRIWCQNGYYWWKRCEIGDMGYRKTWFIRCQPRGLTWCVGWTRDFSVHHSFVLSRSWWSAFSFWYWSVCWMMNGWCWGFELGL